VNPSTAQARVIIDELLRCGVSDIVLSPGSRSAALAIAAAEAELRMELRLHVRVDERSAAYLALGLAKITGVPAAVITTSGTAAVNLHPAVVEADLSGIPMMLLTADRPPELRDVGANQTIRQPGIFGEHARAAIDMSVAREAVGQVRYWRSTIARAVALSTDAVRPGPVHVNIPFAEPIVADADGLEWIESLDGRDDGRPWTADARLIAGMSTPLDDILESLIEGAEIPPRGLIIVGDHDGDDAVELIDDLADTAGWPVIGEPTANVAGCDTVLAHGALLLADEAFCDEHVPDIIITVGRVGLSRGLLRMIARTPLHIAVDQQPSWSDPMRSADLVVTSVPLPPEDMEIDESWLSEWQRADVLAAAAVETALAGDGELLTGAHIARVIAPMVPDGGMLFCGPSWPIRHLLNFASTSVRDAIVLANRGTSGIDGTISSAWGAARALQDNGGSAAIAFVGDLTFLYDSNALSVPANEDRPDLVYVVADNSGGGIFSSLEQGDDRFAKVFERVFGTPSETDIAALAQSYGAETVRVTTADELRESVDSALEAGGVHVIVATTCDRDRESRMLRNVQRAISEALASA
jgi:2-succinyl-5-enolpyruvyl-6-hydroxy-3-cyclohexene-1-carboxylate synthase